LVPVRNEIVPIYILELELELELEALHKSKEPPNMI
jgi:hypothetical protein